jgi:metallo-beta-lactamase family protein
LKHDESKMVKIGFYGAAGQVTGSNFVVDTGENKYIVDCGLFQGGGDAPEENKAEFDYDPSEAKAVIVTHAHLDHIGRLPMLFRDGYRGPIYVTEATAELTTLTLKDAFDIMTHNHEREGWPMLYQEEDLNRALNAFVTLEYHQEQELSGSDSVTLYDAGHILGSSVVLLNAGGKKIVFSGDVGYAPGVLLPEPESPLEADCIVTEATYGGVNHEKKQDRLEVLRNALEWTIQNKGVLLIPAFAVERTQELLFLFNELSVQHKLPRIPIFLDSPLAIEALEVFDKHMELYSKAVQKIRQDGDLDIFSFRGLALTPTSSESKEINDQPPPKVIVAGSGMMEGGRIFHHLQRYLDSPRTMLLVIGYQAKGTLGSTIVGGAKEVRINRRTIPVKAKVEVVDIFSGHADNVKLIEWIKGIKLAENGKVFIVHSEPDRAELFRQELAEIFPGRQIAAAIEDKIVEI